MNTIKKFIHYYGPYKTVFFIDLICAAVISLIDLAYPQILRTMTKTLFTQDQSRILHPLPVIAGGLFLMYVIQCLCKYYVTCQGHMMGANMERDMRQELFDHYQQLSFSYYSQNNSGQMMSKLVSDLFDISEFAHHGPENLFISLVKIVGSFIFLFLINKKLALPLIVLVILMFLFSFRQNQKMQRTFMDKLKEALNTVHGGFAYLLMTEDAMIGALDPNGFRPLSLGKMKNGAYVLASETCALDVVGAELVRNIRPGEIVVVNDHGYKIVQYTNNTQLAICSMEYIYFARPDSDIYGVNVHSARKRMGARLAAESPVEADMVIGVPNSSLSAASGYAEAAGLPNEMGLIKNQYVARTFIQPTQELREQGVRMKLSAVRSVVKGKRVVVIDDSIVRGTTSKRIVQLLKEAGAAEVHMRISSPPLKYPCFYGIDISTTKELIAAKMSVEEIREYIGADSLAYLSLDGLVESIGLNADAPYGGLCVAYFNGDYPTALDDYEADFLKSLTPEDRVRLPEFALYKSKYIGNEYNTVQPDAE